jgi:hypothetical protein
MTTHLINRKPSDSLSSYRCEKPHRTTSIQGHKHQIILGEIHTNLFLIAQHDDKNADPRIANWKNHLYDVYQHEAHQRSQQAAGVTLKPA